MKATWWAAIVLGALTLVVVLSPFAVQIDSEGAAWLAYFVAVLAWYLIGPILLVITTIVAATASVLSVRRPEHSRGSRRAVGWCWAALVVVEVAVALYLLRLPHAVPEPGPAIVMGSVVAATGISALVVALHARAQNAGEPAVKRWHVLVGVVVPITVLLAALLIVLHWALSPASLPVGALTALPVTWS